MKKELKIIQSLEKAHVPKRDSIILSKKEEKFFSISSKQIKKDSLVDIEQSIQKCLRLGVFK